MDSLKKIKKKVSNFINKLIYGEYNPTVLDRIFAKYVKLMYIREPLTVQNDFRPIQYDTDLIEYTNEEFGELTALSEFTIFTLHDYMYNEIYADKISVKIIHGNPLPNRVLNLTPEFKHEISKYKGDYIQYLKNQFKEKHKLEFEYIVKLLGVFLSVILSLITITISACNSGKTTSKVNEISAKFDSLYINQSIQQEKIESIRHELNKIPVKDTLINNNYIILDSLSNDTLKVKIVQPKNDKSKPKK